MTLDPAPSARFRYDGYELDPARSRLTCRYSLGDRRFSEEVTFDLLGSGGTCPAAERQGAGWTSPAADAAARLVFLLAGVSYYKTSAPPVVDLGDLETTEGERRFLRQFYVDGMGEFAYRNGLDLSILSVVGPDASPRPPVAYTPAKGHPLVPFGGGIDSIVVAESVRELHPDAALFIVSRHGDRFDAIEAAAAAARLPIARAERQLDPAVLRSAELGFLNGHVPVTGIISAIAVMAAVLGGHDAVVLSNERSASAPSRRVGSRAINHQWSKSLTFERGFRQVLAATFGPGLEYYSLLRPWSELAVAQRFAGLDRYHRVFRSCNRAFHIDPERRLDHWCGTCDKCCFIDLVLAPFLGPAELSAIFGGREPLGNPALVDRFRALLGTGSDPKPFECVGDAEECRAATHLAAARTDRSSHQMLQQLAGEIGEDPRSTGPVAESLFMPSSDHFVPPHYPPLVAPIEGADVDGTGPCRRTDAPPLA